MYFESLADLWHMSGHGRFVWSAYACVLITIVVLLEGSLNRSFRVLQRVRRRVEASRPPRPPET
jgi:heme exporter protein D